LTWIKGAGAGPAQDGSPIPWSTPMIRLPRPFFAIAFAVPLLAGGCAHDPAKAAAAEATPPHAGGQHAGPGPHGMHGGQGMQGGRMVHRDGHAPGAASTAPAGDPAAAAARFVADEPLSRGMARVRAATDLLAHAAMGHMDATQVKAQAAELKSAVDTMFAECKLEPAADAAVHPLLARVLTASAAMADGEYDAAAHADLKAVLVRYAELFDDPAAGAGAAT
jgi:hypothetical protein